MAEETPTEPKKDIPVTISVTTSPSKSAEGFSFKAYLVRNKKGIKIVIGLLGGYLASAVSGITDPTLNTLVSTAAGLLIKFGADFVDYWLSDVPIEGTVDVSLHDTRK